MEKHKDEQAKMIKKWKTKATNMEQERDFLNHQVLESKRQNKLLKMAISRLQSQASNPIDIDEDNGNTFLTEAKN